MRLEELNEAEIERIFVLWTRGNPTLKMQAVLRAKQQLRIKPGSPEEALAQFQEKINQRMQELRAPYFARAVKEGNSHIPMKDLGGAEIIRQFVDEITVEIPPPPEVARDPEWKEKMVQQIKLQSEMMIGGFIEETVGEVASEINRAFAICEEMGVSLENMLQNEDLSKEYMRRRYTKEEYLRMCEAQIARMVAAIGRMAKIQTNILVPPPPLHPNHPQYAKAMRKRERIIQALEWQIERRKRKLEKVARKQARQFAKEIWG